MIGGNNHEKIKRREREGDVKKRITAGSNPFPKKTGKNGQEGEKIGRYPTLSKKEEKDGEAGEKKRGKWVV